MAFKPFKALTSILRNFTRPNSVLKGPTIPNFKTVASKKGIIIITLQMQIIQTYHSNSSKFFVYPIDVKDQDIIFYLI